MKVPSTLLHVLDRRVRVRHQCRRQESRRSPLKPANNGVPASKRGRDDRKLSFCCYWLDFSCDELRWVKTRSLRCPLRAIDKFAFGGYSQPDPAAPRWCRSRGSSPSRRSTVRSSATLGWLMKWSRKVESGGEGKGSREQLAVMGELDEAPAEGKCPLSS